MFLNEFLNRKSNAISRNFIYSKIHTQRLNLRGKRFKIYESVFTLSFTNIEVIVIDYY